MILLSLLLVLLVQPMSIDPFKNHMKELVKGLNVDGSHDACYGIMTTDTQPKKNMQ